MTTITDHDVERSADVDLYGVLHVTAQADAELIDRAYRVRMHAVHPDHAAAAVLRAVRNDRLPVSVPSGWVLLPPGIAAALSLLSFDLEKRVLNRYPRRELPVRPQSTAYTWSQVRAFRRLYAQTPQERPRGLLEG